MIYLDNSATTAIDPEVMEAMLPYLAAEYGNPSSKYYPLATGAQRAIEESREKVAALIQAKPEEIIFTCGSTESSNLIIKGIADYRKYYEKRGNHLITSKAEHHATLNTCRYLNGEIYSNHDATFSLSGHSPVVDRGFQVTFLDVDPLGRVLPEVLEQAIRPETTLVTLMWANNEIGTINDIPALCAAAHRHGVPFHTDATQVSGKLPISVKDTPVDFMSLSAHKFHGPKGVGAAYLRSDEYGLPPITALLHGGEQESGIRAGTLAVHNIVGFGKAAELALARQDTRLERLSQLDAAARALFAGDPRLELLGDGSAHIPGLLSVIVHSSTFDNERFIQKASGQYAFSSGSACTAGEPSHVLQAIGRSGETSRVLRISLSETSSIDDLKGLVELLKHA